MSQHGVDAYVVYTNTAISALRGFGGPQSTPEPLLDEIGACAVWTPWRSVE